VLPADTRYDGKTCAPVIRSRRAGLVSGLDLSFDERLSRSDPGGAIGVQASGFRLGLTFQMTGAIPNRFYASGE